MRGVTSRAELGPRARKLRREGKMLREIAFELGVSKSAVAEWCDPQTNRKRKARRARYAGVCELCGGRTDGSHGPGSAPSRCRSCLLPIWQAERERQAECFCNDLELMWAEGLTIKEIAAEAGWKANSMGAHIARLRAQGKHFPLRKNDPPDARERIKAAARATRAREKERKAA